MSDDFRDVTDAELAVLRCLWEQPALAVRDLADRLYGNPSKSPTVLKLLERLESKGCVVREKSGHVQQFSATVKREDLIGRRLQSVANSLADGSNVPLLMHLVDPQKLTPEEIQQLRELIDDADSTESPLSTKQKKRPKNRRE